MLNRATRRRFLGSSLTVGTGLLLHGLIAPATAFGEEPPEASDSDSAVQRPHPVPAAAPIVGITVVTQDVSPDVNPRAEYWTYVSEILQHAGLFFDRIDASQIASLGERSPAIVLLAGDLKLTVSEKQILRELVERGNTMIGIGGTSGLDEVFGVSGTTPVAEGWIQITAADHPVTRDMRSSLHVFGGCVAKPTTAVSLASTKAGVGRTPVGSAVLEHAFGSGHTLLFGPDLIFSIAHIQQGISVLQDGKPAPDGTAQLDEGTLKAEDGLVLDWQQDRSALQPDDGPVYLEPISDELRELIIRGVLHGASRLHATLPLLWYWPRGLPAVGHISHDSDGNEPDKAEALLDAMNSCGIKSTWCIQYPGGYPRDFYTKLKQQGFEVALHYDAHTGGPQTSWSKENFLLQHQWLLEEADLPQIISNKNHYTRWENRLDFFRWCEEVKILSDQTRGPSKKGTIGFPLGGSHPYFPLDPEANPPRVLDVLEINMLTQDLVIVCPREYGRQLLDSVLRHHGVAHFLFHPAHILKPGVADALRELVDYGQSQGLEWWTSADIVDWERARRKVHVHEYGNGPDVRIVTLRAETPLHEATILWLATREASPTITVNGQRATSQRRAVYGFSFDAITADLTGETTVEIG